MPLVAAGGSPAPFTGDKYDNKITMVTTDGVSQRQIGWAVLVFSGCTSDVDTYAAVQADLADAIHQAAKGGIHD